MLDRSDAVSIYGPEIIKNRNEYSFKLYLPPKHHPQRIFVHVFIDIFID